MEFERGGFNDLHICKEDDPVLYKFIMDIETKTHSFGDYSFEELSQFANKIRRLQKQL